MSDIEERVLRLVESIPEGRVMTYGDIADAVGTGARMVGRILHRSHDIPWWRVVTSDGRAFPGALQDARRRFIDESTPLKTNTDRDLRVDLASAAWIATPAEPGSNHHGKEHHMSTTLTTDQLPPTVAQYLKIRESAESYRVAELFAVDAEVSDEGRVYRGRDEIRSWVDETNTAYRYTTVFLGARELDGMIGTSFRLEGDFPGGVVELEYQFRLSDDGLISHLYFA